MFGVISLCCPEYLVATSCMLASRGELNVATSLVDDEGVDLVFNRRDHSATLAQVKARMSDGQLVQDGTVRAQVRAQTFRARPGPRHVVHRCRYRIRPDHARLDEPSPVFAELASGPNSRGRLRLSASMKPGTRDKWIGYQLTAAELAPRILARLTDLYAAA
jgi:hypothetical protein